LHPYFINCKKKERGRLQLLNMPQAIILLYPAMLTAVSMQKTGNKVVVRLVIKVTTHCVCIEGMEIRVRSCPGCKMRLSNI
jgi:hypothetical protein